MIDVSYVFIVLKYCHFFTTLTFSRGLKVSDMTEWLNSSLIHYSFYLEFLESHS